MRQQRGFNLMELMVAVTIIGIIVAVALPSYNSHMLNTRRTASAACVVELGQFMERVYTTSMSYAVDNGGVATVLPNTSCRNDLAVYYTMTLTTTPQTFTLTATPIGSQAKDTTCGVLTLNQAGTRTAAGSATAAKVRECW
ncbi:MAG: prepilin-type N-terminal cleavage/methylation domain-containing protein [Gammaproteobacteria bacterium]|jgi:type IV pilus assembly protein PilE|nr:prepilin-type N-terminal cleavage/methylation domain-containing protein [Gammaproteobacteria bacterium]MBU2178491.1 prepilin-type N-terminal cleavage/methylation domain-containing protein [Gammaproteobacteria bacterium]MBU2225118.1 prepilin-type N-terminal cleavage/methylation domain-containing protein [Gammaproteobacteria bacterium]MBU2279248.1 prepilin-type N-terminal cleavage/methylation domain-containing protein [Gammaproteobacteria bacterium]MBU2428711.1 prepilin-type N-terminal cleavag